MASAGFAEGKLSPLKLLPCAWPKLLVLSPQACSWNSGKVTFEGRYFQKRLSFPPTALSFSLLVHFMPNLQKIGRKQRNVYYKGHQSLISVPFCANCIASVPLQIVVHFQNPCKQLLKPKFSERQAWLRNKLLWQGWKKYLFRRPDQAGCFFSAMWIASPSAFLFQLVSPVKWNGLD